MLVVIDTNILVRALWSKSGLPAKFVSLLFTGEIIACYDYRLLQEYRQVLAKEKFGFTKWEINSLIDWIVEQGISVIAPESNDFFIDESDKKFYEVAKYCNALLVTSNKKHYPNDENIISVKEFFDQMI